MSDDLALDRQVCFALYSASRATTAAYRGMLDRLGVTYPQYLVLLALWEQESRGDHSGRGVRDLCDALDLDTGTLSPLLKRLESAGLLERRRQSSDERRVQIHLTEAGRELRARAEDIPARMARASGLAADELAALRDTLHRMTEALHRPETPDPHPATPQEKP
ncbi:organic hydroperoxide resistance transcriptional regulator [Rhodococcus aetherivorans]|uniref:Organic hydroperoxide resistance transcriptional regulator n=1 Tax=Rhodococcus aetherivorans TaxID=191292 RepID=A0ABQ0YMA1_9NOCA|nr:MULTISPECIES: MarR family transcriptional regulator [Rhodococcus]ETT26052.1 transcriptional regulator, MarR family [Rhodococcus rhodochrous ATCC 21198]NCL77671.1 Organic hydroperoxide resistance transcriptional regulator [Rhodococcus sp. YH1]ANZ26472.1 MarR family transcriptional regulator [Rhodococcus sp. WB1]MDV6294522.1 MarR family transcriptional regulator [Rhodococcus aetherivorans]NGP26357.1 MarR family transcriptional regulator [Rhodococcus aetherivorans]